jgi:hypothetical protein
MAERYVVDVATNTILLFPDHLSLVIISEADDAGEVTLTAEAKLSADPKSLVSLPGSRQIILGDAFFILRRPDSTKVIDFGFFPTGGLSGRLTLTAKKQDFQLIRKKIFGDPSFMEPEYSGRSETFESEVEIASVGLSPLDIESIRGKKFLIPQSPSGNILIFDRAF